VDENEDLPWLLSVEKMRTVIACRLVSDVLHFPLRKALVQS